MMSDPVPGRVPLDLVVRLPDEKLVRYFYNALADKPSSFTDYLARVMKGQLSFWLPRGSEIAVEIIPVSDSPSTESSQPLS